MRRAGSLPRVLEAERLGDHRDRLCRSARALCGAPELAEDLVQETYARVLAKPRLLHRDDDLAYLLRTLRNTYSTHLRTQQRRPRTEPLGEEALEDRGCVTPDAAVDALTLSETISALPIGFREALVAVDVRGLSYREAASVLRVPEGTVMSRLARARIRVARALGVVED